MLHVLLYFLHAARELLYAVELIVFDFHSLTFFRTHALIRSVRGPFLVLPCREYSPWESQVIQHPLSLQTISQNSSLKAVLLSLSLSLSLSLFVYVCVCVCVCVCARA